MASDGVKLFGSWPSLCVRRVEWALKLKGIDYEYIEEDLYNMSDDLLRYYPTNPKVPVLLHNGEPINESLDILKYIDDTWKETPILPEDPGDRKWACSWTDEQDNEAFYAKRERGKAEAIDEVQEILEDVDEELDGKTFFGGESIAYADLALGWVAFWLGVWEEVADFKAMNARKFPSIASWTKNFLEHPLIRDNLPHRDDTVEYFRKLRHDNFHKFRQDMLASSSSS